MRLIQSARLNLRRDSLSRQCSLQRLNPFPEISDMLPEAVDTILVLPTYVG